MLFKYCPPERVDVLKDLRIRFSPLPSLNDPFEQHPLICAKEKFDGLLEENIKNFNNLWEAFAEKDKTEENRKNFEETRSEFVSYFENKTSPSSVGKELVSILSDNFGVLCLSRVKDNLLMWSHYTKQGEGLVIGFDDEHDFFKQNDYSGKPTKPIPVVYTSKRKKVVCSETEFYEKILFEKPLEWAYEEEERITRYFLDKKSGCKDNYGMNVVLTDLPKLAIKAVYLGYRASEETREKCLLAVKKNEISCDIFEAKLSESEYKIDFFNLS